MRPVVLVILDGFGIAPPGPGNAVVAAATPVFDHCWASYPHTSLVASGRAVGLPDGQMGNSEVGHLTIGAGRVVRQELTRLADAIRDGSFLDNPVLTATAQRAAASGGVLHLIGLVSDGGVHSHVDHLRTLVEMADRYGVTAVVHAITDGRDTSPHQAAGLITELEREWRDARARIATLSGRYFAMDRDGRYDRTERFYRALVHGQGDDAASAVAAVEASYAAGVTDEFIAPLVIGPRGRDRIAAGAQVVFFNFRPDRARQICRALAAPAFDGFDRGSLPPIVQLTTITSYGADEPGTAAFAPEYPASVLADVLEDAQVAQLHAAETEKYAHVTYFLNGGRESVHTGEERILVASPRDVATYDQAPGMSAEALTERFCDAFGSGRYGFAVLNFANPDMVGHTGIVPAVVNACGVVDQCLGRVLRVVGDVGGVAVITADHGNAEQMLEVDGSPHTAHTTNPVPFVITQPGLRLRGDGGLADIAPTILDLLGITPPAAMSGRSLITRGGATSRTPTDRPGAGEAPPA